MRREHRKTLAAQRNVRTIAATDLSEDEIDYDSAPPYIQAIIDAIRAERRAYHRICAKQHFTYGARHFGVVDVAREQWLEKRRAYLAREYGG